MRAPGPLLLLEDDAVFAQTLARSLGRRGFAVQICAQGAAALQACHAQQFDYLCLDMHLEQDSGLHWLPQLRAAQPQARIVMLTGYASIATTVQAIKAGADDYLPKPATLEAILHALQAEAHSPPEVEEAQTPATMSVRRLEWEHIQRVLAEHQGNISQAARALNMHRRTLQRKLGKKPAQE
ncbi:response regulator transcription factor [Massilia sp. W12]|uniref:response regulator transcription factor n=1 Tax=Massilia sp. W12 TaxID=3126507 RepID=UPI0030D4AEF9